MGLLGELDAAPGHLLVGRAQVVGGQEHGAGEALAHQLADLLACGVVHHRRSRDRHQRDRDLGLARGADGEPAEVAELGHRDVGSQLHADLLRVEGECLVLVVDPELCCRDLHQLISLFVVGEGTCPR